MLYAFAGDSHGELAVSEDDAVTILDDDGAWMTVRHENTGEEGLVPSSYVKKVKKNRGPPPPVKPRGGGGIVQKKKVRALYAYTPGGEEEVGMRAGEEFVVLERDVGGWVRVKVPGGEGLVPGTYVEDV